MAVFNIIPVWNLPLSVDKFFALRANWGGAARDPKTAFRKRANPKNKGRQGSS
jgi:hypothetical protein